MGNFWNKIWKRGGVGSGVEPTVEKAGCAAAEPKPDPAAPEYDVAFAWIEKEGETPQQKIKDFLDVLCGGYSPLMVFERDGVLVRFAASGDVLGRYDDYDGMDKYREAWVRQVPALWIDAFFEVIQAPDAHEGLNEWRMEDWDWHVSRMLADWSYKEEVQAEWVRAVIENLNAGTLDMIIETLWNAEPKQTQRMIEHLWPEVGKLTDDQINNLLDGIHRTETTFRLAKFREIQMIFQDRPEVQKYLQIYNDSIG